MKLNLLHKLEKVINRKAEVKEHRYSLSRVSLFALLLSLCPTLGSHEE
jgi:hypothetical protein